MRPELSSLAIAVLFTFAGMPWAAFAQSSETTEADPWVARKGGSVVTLKDVDAQLDGLPPAIRAGMMADPKRVEKLIEDLLLNRQLGDKARAAKLDESPLHPTKLKLAEDRFLAQEYTENISHGLTTEQLDLLAQERFLMASPSVFGGTDEKRDVQHILIAYEGRTLVDAKALAEDIHARLLRGEDFDKLAMTYSADKARVDEAGLPKPPGLLPGVGRGETDPDFEKVAFALNKTGDLSEPVQSAHGFHVIKLLRIQPEKRLPYADVRDTVMAETARWLTRKKRDDTMSDLRSLPVEGNKDVIATLTRRYINSVQETGQ